MEVTRVARSLPLGDDSAGYPTAFLRVPDFVQALDPSGLWAKPSLDVGKEFEVMADANPKEKLKEGVILPGWPGEIERDHRDEEVERRSDS